jgi:hypothetical protein
MMSEKRVSVHIGLWTRALQGLLKYSLTKRHPQFTGLVLSSSQKLTFDLLVTIILEVVSFRAYVPFPALQPIFKMHPGSHLL